MGPTSVKTHSSVTRQLIWQIFFHMTHFSNEFCLRSPRPQRSTKNFFLRTIYVLHSCCNSFAEVHVRFRCSIRYKVHNYTIPDRHSTTYQLFDWVSSLGTSCYCTYMTVFRQGVFFPLEVIGFGSVGGFPHFRTFYIIISSSSLYIDKLIEFTLFDWFLFGEPSSFLTRNSCSCEKCSW